jgi:hypothetical protein
MMFYTIPRVLSHAPGFKLFDMLPTGYSFEYASDLLTRLGGSGRDAYLYYQLPLDFIYPGLFAISCSLLLAWLLQKSRSPDSKAYYWCLVPVAAGLFDYLENLFIVSFLLSYPDLSSTAVNISSIVTMAKSGMTSLYFLLLFIYMVAAVKSNFR